MRKANSKVVAKMVELTGQTIQDANFAYRSTVTAIYELLAAGEEVSFIPIGKFKFRRYAARTLSARKATLMGKTITLPKVTVPEHMTLKLITYGRLRKAIRGFKSASQIKPIRRRNKTRTNQDK